jgi:polysaccharide biosynthesis protein PslH
VRILFVCHRIPYPPNKGEKIRAFHQLRAIAARHEVDLFTLADDPDDLIHRETLAAHCRSVTVAAITPKLARIRALPYLLTRTPLTVPYFYSAALQQQLCEQVALREYDRVFVYCSAMAQYVDWKNTAYRSAFAPRAVRPVPIVLDMVDVDSNKWAQYADATTFPFSMVYAKEARDLRRYEARACEAAECVVVSTQREAQLARAIAPLSRVHVVPIGVDSAHFDIDRDRLQPPDPAVVFTGDMSYFPNVEGAVFFAREVLPLIHRELPQVRFLAVGRNPDRRVEELRKLPHVIVTGSVADVRPWLAQAAVTVVPLRIAAGIQTKILEAMAAGLPVVATSRAVQGLTASVAEMVSIGEGAAELAARVVELLQDPALARRRGLESRRRVSMEYSWDTALHRLLHLLEHPDAEPADAESTAFASGVPSAHAVGE